MRIAAALHDVSVCGFPGALVAISIPFPSHLKGGRVVDRPNRIAIRVALEPEEVVVQARLADPAQHAAVLQPNNRVWLRQGSNETWTAMIAQTSGGTLVCLEPLMAPAIVRVALEQERIPELGEWFVERLDAPLGRSRVPFQLSTVAGEQMLVAVLPVTRVEGQVALYPDGANEHSVRMLKDLSQVPRRPGWHATAIFLAVRNDAVCVRPNESEAPACAEVLREAESAGVRLLGLRTQLTLTEMTLGLSLPVDLWSAPG